MDHVVKPGQSLWTIAEVYAGAGASAAEIQQASNAIADASGLARDAKLERGQRIVIPDRFAGRVRSDAVARDAMPRLGGVRGGNAVLSARLAQKEPLLGKLRPRLVDTPVKRVEAQVLPAIGGVVPEASVYRFEGVKTSLDASAHLTIGARFGRLTRAQFDAIHAELGGRSKLAYDPEREYTFTDFLPPVLRALAGKDLDIPDAVTLKGSKHLDADMNQGDFSVGLTMNCHAAAWEGARAYQHDLDEVSIFYGEMITMDSLVSGSEERFQKIGELPAERLGELAKLDLRPGDVVQFFEVSDWARMTMLLHSAVYTGGGLFFEKPNTEGPERAQPEKYIVQEETPYRLATAELMAKPISAFVEGKFRVEVYRPKVPLQVAEKAFESSIEEAANAWATKKGRTLGVELVSELEQGMGGGIRGEHISALVTLPLEMLG